MVAVVTAGCPVVKTRNTNLKRTTTMRKTIIFGAIAAVFGLVVAAHASEHAERAVKNGGQISYAEADERGEMARHWERERAEYSVRGRDDDTYEHSKEARERKHREHDDRD
jgi:hypothetical protein